MKKLFAVLILCFILSVVFTPIIQAQSDPPGISVSTPDPTGLGEVLGTVGGAIGLILSVTGWLKQTIKWQGRAVTYISWIVSLVVCGVGWLLKLGIFDFSQWWFVPIYALLLGLATNKIFDEKWLNWFLLALRAQVKPK